MNIESKKYHRERLHRQEFNLGYYLQKNQSLSKSRDLKTLKIISTFSNHLLKMILSTDLDAWGLEYHVTQDSFDDLAVQLERLKLDGLKDQSAIVVIRDTDLIGSKSDNLESVKNRLDVIHFLISQLSNIDFYIIPIFAVTSTTSQKILNQINAYLLDQVSSIPNVTILNQLFESYGRTNTRMILDKKSVNFQTSPLSIDFIKEISYVLTFHICLSNFTSAKVICIDADNILWSGVIGESALEEIRNQFLDPENPYLHLQNFLVQQMKNGFILCLVSKNNLFEIENIFREIPEMPLKLEMFTRTEVNWNEKVDNVKSISQSLNLGLQDFVFLDDSPIEREKMRFRVPEIFTPEIHSGEELQKYIKTMSPLISRSLTLEDGLRVTSYLNRDRMELERANFTSLEDFLSNLQMSSLVTSNDDLDVLRALQIIQKTNQFNMTGLRIEQQNLETMLKSDKYLFFQGTLSDKYGEYGNVILSCFEKLSETTMRIVLFNMSCRVIGRNLEFEHLAWIINLLQKYLGVSEFVVQVTPTKKNSNFIDFFDKSGFVQISPYNYEFKGFTQNKFKPNFIEIEGTGKWKK